MPQASARSLTSVCCPRAALCVAPASACFGCASIWALILSSGSDPHLKVPCFIDEPYPYLTCLLVAEAQVEGAFVMGMGLQTQEEVVVDPETGHLLSDGTWTYKIPTAACIPRKLNIAFLKV